MFDWIKNKTVFANKYHTHSEAAIVTCFYNPQKSSSRMRAFQAFYESIKHLNHAVLECVIGDDQPQLLNNKNVKIFRVRNLLWHKETLINKAIASLPSQFRYIFWVDADVIFTNLDWLVNGVAALQSHNIIQPFEYCVHLEQDQLKPSFDLSKLLQDKLPNRRNDKVWRSFSANFADTDLWRDSNYNTHGHVGFAWGARREVLEAVPLYDKALIGGADHIIAHAAAGQIPHPCITKSFTENLSEVEDWSRKFYRATAGKIGYVPGELYHIWHGDIANRDYLKRIQDFTPMTKSIHRRDENGFYETDDADITTYVEDYFDRREVNTDDKECTEVEAVDTAYLLDNSGSLGTSEVCETFS
jgi:hypothetical protein